MLQIGQYQPLNQLFVAPMAGVTDQPFRKLCRSFGAGYSVGEMVTSKPELWHSLKTSRRLNHDLELRPIAVQIAGTDAAMMAEATRYNIERGAQIIDINMGCPAKKVCNKLAGAALMRDEKLALEIITAVVQAAATEQVPVSLKMRTGWDENSINAPRLALLAEQAGVQLITVHGRSREQGYRGSAEYDTIALIKSQLKIPLVANGDIDSPEKAKQVLDYTKADAIMIGRAAQGRPWIFQEIAHYLRTGERLTQLPLVQIRDLILEHLQDHYLLYGEYSGTRSVRKHITWYAKQLPGGDELRLQINKSENAQQQQQLVEQYFSTLLQQQQYLSTL